VTIFFKLFLCVSENESTSFLHPIFGVQCCQSVIRNLYIYNVMYKRDCSSNDIITYIVSISLQYSSKIKYINKYKVLQTIKCTQSFMITKRFHVYMPGSFCILHMCLVCMLVLSSLE